MKNFLSFLSFGLLVIIFSFGCKKKDNNSKPTGTDYTSGMGGVRIWHGTFSGENFGSNFYTIVTDTFPIIIINDSEIGISNNVNLGIDSCVLKLSATDSVSGKLTFSTVYVSYPFGNNFIVPCTITYYYSGDSILLGGFAGGLNIQESVYVIAR